jgi:Flp pilus assembly protein TadD
MRKSSLPLLGLALALGLAGLALQPGCIKRDLMAGEKPGPEGAAQPASATAQADVVVTATPEPTRTVGDTFYARGDFRHAIAYLREEVKKDPGNAHLWRHLGSAYGQFEDYNNAIYCYKRTLALNPTDLKTFYNLSLVYDFKGALPDAEQIATKGLAMDGKDAELHASLGNILADEDKDDKAMEHYKTALELRPRDAVTRFNKGALHFKRREFKEAEVEYRAVLTLSPKDMEAAENLSAIYILENRLPDAEKLNRWVVQNAPKNEDTLENAYFNLGIILDREEKISQALDMYKLALQVAPWDAAAYVNAAVILERLSRTGEALSYWEKYCRLFPASKRQAEITKRIKLLKKMVDDESASGAKPKPLPTPRD